jgi:hypothetical protein
MLANCSYSVEESTYTGYIVKELYMLCITDSYTSLGQNGIKCIQHVLNTTINNEQPHTRANYVCTTIMNEHHTGIVATNPATQ